MNKQVSAGVFEESKHYYSSQIDLGWSKMTDETIQSCMVKYIYFILVLFCDFVSPLGLWLVKWLWTLYRDLFLVDASHLAYCNLNISQIVKVEEYVYIK